MTRIVQIQKDNERKVALVEGSKLRLLRDFKTTESLAQQAISTGTSLSELVRKMATDEVLDYDAIYEGRSDWRLLVPIDHAADSSRCLVSGTGLTHLGSAKDRQDMHINPNQELTDSMKIFRWGVERGRPAAGQIGVAPEWFYKGSGKILRAHNESLVVPSYAEDGGEEAEIAGIYMIDQHGNPWRIGMTIGNEFSDHRFEKRNYLNLAGSKIRTCSLGPELVIDPDFGSVKGTVRLERKGELLWSKEIQTGEAEMCHSLQNIEHHHFKFETHRRPGDLHVHYFGACSLSFGAGIQLKDGDLMKVEFAGFGRPLCNPLRTENVQDSLVKIQKLT